MTHLAYNLASWKRAARVTVVALATVSSLALLGALPASEAKGTKKAAAAVAAAPAVKANVVSATIATPAAKAELLEAVVDSAVQAKATIPAARRYRTLRMEVTAYCACTKCCGPNAQGITASGKPVSHNNGKFVAADTSVLGFGTKIVVPGYAGEQEVEVLDRGGAIKGNKLDLFFDSHEAALEWGRQQLDVVVYEN